MTCLIGLKQDGVVYIGSDSGIYSGYNTINEENKPVFSKVFQKGDFIFATTGNVRGSRLIEHIWTAPERGMSESVEHYIYNTVVKSIQSLFTENGFMVVKESKQTSLVSYIFAYDGRLFELGPDFCTLEYDRYIAAGAGEEYALGSLYSTKDKNPEDRITIALEAASKFCTHVDAPFIIKSQKAKSENIL